MNQTRNKTKLLSLRFLSSIQCRRKSLAAAACTVLTACAFVTGCASHDTPPPATGQTAAGLPTAPTPEQEAAKQHGMQVGQAMQAAHEAAAKAAHKGQ